VHRVDDPPNSDGENEEGKGGWRTGILHELIFCRGPELQCRLLVLMREVWKMGCSSGV